MVKEIEYFRMPLNSVHISQNYKLKHKAIDLTSPEEGKEANILAIFNGTVSRVLKSKTGGNIVELKHNYDGKTWFAQFKHCAQIYVKKGDSVRMGQAIAKIGDTGTLATGVHVHYCLFRCPLNYKEPATRYAVNPRSYTYLHDDQTVDAKSAKYFKRVYGLPAEKNYYKVQVIVRGDVNCRNNPAGKVLGETVNGFYDFDMKVKKGRYYWYHIGGGEYVASVKNKVEETKEGK